MKWEKIAVSVNSEGKTITYQAAGTNRQLLIQSRLRHIPHANGIGTWDHTTYHVICKGQEEKRFWQRLNEAKEEAEKIWKKLIGEIKVIAKKPNTDWYETNVSNTLDALQEFVGGYIETVTLARGISIICNEEGRIRNLPHCCTVGDVDFVGNVLLVGTDEDEFCDVPVHLEAWKALVSE